MVEPRSRRARSVWPRLRQFVVIAAISLAPGCSFGPRALERTHGPYAAAVQQVDEEQFLKNIVRLRYLEAPTSLEVASIAAQYELSASAEARPFFSTEAAGTPAIFRPFTAILPFGSVSGANRPTVSMTPQDDASSVRQMLTPISTETVVFLAQSGWPISSIFRLWVDRLNGVPNLAASAHPSRDLAPDYERFSHACELLQRIQDQEMMSLHTVERMTEVSGPLPANMITAAATLEAAKSGYEYRPRADGNAWSLVRLERRLVLQVNPSGKGSPELAELATLLNLQPDLDRYDVVVATGVPDPLRNPSAPGNEFRITPRSTSQTLFYMANGVDVPADHVARGLVPVPAASGPCGPTHKLFNVHVSKGHCRPANAYIAVRYRDHWFYIDDRDQDSKATVMLMLQLRRLDFKRQQIGAAPALTLPVGR